MSYRYDHRLAYELTLPKYAAPVFIEFLDRYSDRLCRARVDHVVEEVRRVARRDQYQYRVVVSGPRQTSKGADHGAQREEVEFQDCGYLTSRLRPASEIPAGVAEYLLGEDAIRKTMGVPR